VDPTNRPNSSRHETLSSADRNAINAVSEWLSPVPWQYFVTLEFPWNVGQMAATVELEEYLNAVEQQLRESVCFIAGLEGKSKAGINVPWHFHMLVTASRQIPMDLLKELWWAREGRGTRSELHPEGDSIVVLPFEADRHGLEYCLKFANDCRGDWMFKWIEIFNPDIPRSADHRVVRRRKRSQEPESPRQT